MASAAAAAIILHPALRTVPRRILVLGVDGNQLVQEGLAALIDREEEKFLLTEGIDLRYGARPLKRAVAPCTVI